MTDRGHLALIRYRELKEQRDLDESISHFEHAQKLCPLENSSRAAVLFNLATAKLIYCRMNDVSPDLDVPIDLYRAALHLRPRDHPDHPFTLLSLGIALQARFQRQHDAADEKEAQNLLSQVLDVSPTDSYAYHAAVLALGSAAKLELIKRTETPQTSENNVDDHGKVERLDTALQWVFYPDSSRHALLDHLGILFCIQLYYVPDFVDPEKAISMLEVVVRFTSDSHPDKALWSNNLGKILLTRYERFGDIVGLEKSILMREEAVRLTADGDPKKPTWLSSLGYSLLTRYERFGDVVDLEKSISMREEVLQLTPDGHPEKPVRLDNLAFALSDRYEHFGDIADLEKSISMTEEALQLLPDGHPEKSVWLGNLGSSLSARYKRFGDVADLEKSISLKEEALQLTPDNHPDMASRLGSLVSSFSARYKRFGDIIDLEKSISLREKALELTPDSHPDKALELGSLGSSLSARYKRFGDIVDLEKSISLREKALELTPDSHPDKALELGSLASSLSTRYKRFGDVVDLEKSISMREQALQLTPDGHPDKPLWLNNLGSSLSTRYQRFGDVVDLQKSISLREEALQLTPDGHPDKPVRLANLGYLLSTRFERFGDADDLEKSISMTEEALQLTPDGHPDKPSWLDNLGYKLSIRYERLGDVVDLEKSTSLTEEALQLTPDGHPDKALRLEDLSFQLLRCFQQSGDLSSSDLPRAILYSSQAARSRTSPTSVCFRASQLWVECIRLQHDPQCLLDAYTVAVDLLPQLAWIGLSLHDRYHQLLQAADAVCDAAAAALEAHFPELAVEWLEQGRSIVWSQLSQLRTPVDDLRTAHPELAAQFERVSYQLEHTGTRDRAALNELTSHSNMVDGLLENQASQHHTLAIERERLLAEIRALPGFERFLLPKTIDQLSSLTHLGPVIFLNASKYRCDALVVVMDSERVVHVPLSNTNYDEVAFMRLRLAQLLTLKGRVISRDDSNRGARLSGMSPDEVFGHILPSLWDKVVSPILDALAFSVCEPKSVSFHN